jgi:hypothetical protein
LLIPPSEALESGLFSASLEACILDFVILDSALYYSSKY